MSFFSDYLNLLFIILDAQKQNEVLQEESKKEKNVLMEQISILESKNDDNEDVVKAKKR